MTMIVTKPKETTGVNGDVFIYTQVTISEEKKKYFFSFFHNKVRFIRETKQTKNARWIYISYQTNDDNINIAKTCLTGTDVHEHWNGFFSLL